MADTPRSRSALLSQFPDNTSGDITPQDMRDLIVSVLGSVGGLAVVDGTAQQTGINATFAKVTLFDQNFAAGDNITADHTTDSVTVLEDGIYEVFVQCSFEDGSNDTFDFAVSVNGTPSAIRFQRKLGTSGDVGSASCMGPLDLSSGDVLTLEVKSDGTNDDIVLVHSQFYVKRVL